MDACSVPALAELILLFSSLNATAAQCASGDVLQSLNLASSKNTELANESSSNDAVFVGNSPLLALLPTGGGEQERVRHRERCVLQATVRSMFEIRALSAQTP